MIITVGGAVLLPNRPGQEVCVWIEGGEDVKNVELRVQIDRLGPRIERVDVLANTIFALNNNGQRRDLDGLGPDDLAPSWEKGGTATESGFVKASGLLGRVFVTTKGIYEGSWTMKAWQTFDGDTALYDYKPEFRDGILKICKVGV